jgi:hypothetical protein
MTRLSQRSLFWAPRILSLAFIAFLSLFALDVFGEAHGFWKTALALIIHLIPSLVLLVVLVLAWRWEWVGATLFGAAGMLYVVLVAPRRMPPAIKLSWISLISGPAFVVAALFLANWMKRGEIHAARQ